MERKVVKKKNKSEGVEEKGKRIGKKRKKGKNVKKGSERNEEERKWREGKKSSLLTRLITAS